ncbi:hypothetical protein BCR44DRAFT_1500139 [Catenaria anguillulae PL171]|uniref:Uncharacterized protein n=1 Tax=Catenaria anguillulae PL171 TaxID=765915 RepID=A0A1Y2HK43_9FUNG|nr:hypothetical protein BCR44DRAFT_1500139 [Catenaria anguillulae PL171]
MSTSDANANNRPPDALLPSQVPTTHAPLPAAALATMDLPRLPRQGTIHACSLHILVRLGCWRPSRQRRFRTRTTLPTLLAIIPTTRIPHRAASLKTFFKSERIGPVSATRFHRAHALCHDDHWVFGLWSYAPIGLLITAAIVFYAVQLSSLHMSRTFLRTSLRILIFIWTSTPRPISGKSRTVGRHEPTSLVTLVVAPAYFASRWLDTIVRWSVDHMYEYNRRNAKRRETASPSTYPGVLSQLAADAELPKQEPPGGISRERRLAMFVASAGQETKMDIRDALATKLAIVISCILVVGLIFRRKSAPLVPYLILGAIVLVLIVFRCRATVTCGWLKTDRISSGVGFTAVMYLDLNSSLVVLGVVFMVFYLVQDLALLLVNHVSSKVAVVLISVSLVAKVVLACVIAKIAGGYTGSASLC